MKHRISQLLKDWTPAALSAEAPEAPPAAPAKACCAHSKGLCSSR